MRKDCAKFATSKRGGQGEGAEVAQFEEEFAWLRRYTRVTKQVALVQRSGAKGKMRRNKWEF